MQPLERESYLATEILTATPQKLQLMLIEAAIRCVQRARREWREEAHEEAAEALIRAQQIIGELLAGLNQDVNPDLVGKVASVYVFVFRRLMEANYQYSEEKLEDALRVLEAERETWRRVCRQLAGETPSDGQAAEAASERESARSGADRSMKTPVAPSTEAPASPIAGGDSTTASLWLEA